MIGSLPQKVKSQIHFENFVILHLLQVYIFLLIKLSLIRKSFYLKFLLFYQWILHFTSLLLTGAAKWPNHELPSNSKILPSSIFGNGLDKRYRSTSYIYHLRQRRDWWLLKEYDSLKISHILDWLTPYSLAPSSC